MICLFYRSRHSIRLSTIIYSLFNSMTVWADISPRLNEQTILTPASRPSSPSLRRSSTKPSARRKKISLYSHSSQPVYTSVNPFLDLASAHSVTHPRPTHQAGLSCPRCIGSTNRTHPLSPSHSAFQDIDIKFSSFEALGYDNHARRNSFTAALMARNLTMLRLPSSSTTPYSPPSSTSWSTLLGCDRNGSSG
jgi:hypothetical protein